ncbi:MAG TPA: DMT family transporter [Synergistaceae bacterium]|nr:DMT family transporter [Synergistaceae bacterium]HQH77522.1 DMT family transporter [Synergistaceae bacterium]
MLWGALTFMLFTWSSAFPAIRIGLSGFSPTHLALFRFLVASGALILYALAVRMPLPEMRDVPKLAGLGCLAITLYHIPLNLGEMTISAGAASLLMSTAPVCTALLAAAILGNPFSRGGWIGLGVSFLGAGLIALSEGGLGGFSVGALWVLLSVVSESLAFVLQGGMLKKYGPLKTGTYLMWTGTAFMLPFGGGLFDAIAKAPWEATAVTIYLGLFPAALAYLCWSLVLVRLKPAHATATFYAIGPLALLISWLWIGERPLPLAIGGGALALLGVWIVERSRRT